GEALPPEGEALPPEGEALRVALRRMASPVVVVTTEGARGPRGATIGSFTSVSLAPPLVSFNVTRRTQLHTALAEASVFAVHLLAADQAALAAHFALPDQSGAAQFAPFEHVRHAGRPPLLAGTLGVLVCRPAGRFEAADHTVMLGEVTEIVPGREDAPPLLYYAQSYRGVGEEVALGV
ncbi:MAG: flavin reductase family protein, partial [Rubricoccaceae bacterium]